MPNFADDPRPLFARAVAQGQAVVDRVPLDRLSSPTPCSEFDVAELTNHLIGAMARVADAFAGNEMPELVASKAVPEVGFSAAFAAASAAAEAAMTEDALLEKLITLPWATLPGSVIVQIYALEAVLHTWDIAAAIGQRELLDDGIAAGVMPIALQMLPPEPRGGEMPFAAVVEVAQGTSASDSLAAYCGRDPHFG